MFLKRERGKEGLGRGEGREKEKERNTDVKRIVLGSEYWHPNQELNQQPRLVPCLGIELVTFWSAG